MDLAPVAYQHHEWQKTYQRKDWAGQLEHHWKNFTISANIEAGVVKSGEGGIGRNAEQRLMREGSVLWDMATHSGGIEYEINKSDVWWSMVSEGEATGRVVTMASEQRDSMVGKIVKE